MESDGRIMNTLDRYLYLEIDGFWCFCDNPAVGSYSAHALRELADRLDALNAERWSRLEEGLVEDRAAP